MQLKERINLKLFLPLSLGTTALFLLFSRNLLDASLIVIIYIATLINLSILLIVISRLFFPKDKNFSVKDQKFKVALIFLGKMLILLVALSLGVLFMGNRIIIPVLNYVVQIFVLGVSLKRG